MCPWFDSRWHHKKKETQTRLFLFIVPFALFCSHLLEGFTKDVVAGVAGYGAFILAPQERPVIKVLKVVGLAEQQAGSHVTGYE